MRSVKISAVLLASALAACAPDAPSPLAVDGAGALTQSRSEVTAARLVPFRATYRAPVGFTPVPPEVCPTELADIASGGGQASHLGRFSGETFSCIDLQTLQATDGRFTFTGADGSQVTGTYELQGTPLSPTLLSLEGPFSITGGTRRFTGASGGGQVSGTADLASGELVLYFDGEISSVGSLP